MVQNHPLRGGDSREDFYADFDEDRVAAALPGDMAYLASIEQQPTLSESALRLWRRLRKTT